MDTPSIPVLQPLGLDEWFIEEEVLQVIRSLPPNKTPGLDGFTTRFLQQTWDIIKDLDLMEVFDVFWHMDTRSFRRPG
jgi:hypothetical protein